VSRFNDLRGDIFNAASRVLDPYTPADADEIRWLADSYIDQLTKLNAAADHGHKRKVHARTRWMLKSPGNKVIAMILAYPKCGKARPKVSLGQIKARARQFDMYKPTMEMVAVNAIAKSDGHAFRTIANFGVRTRAAQRLALDTMRAIWGESRFEFARRGRGRDAMIEHIAKVINSGRKIWIAESDLKDFFPSFDRRAVVHTVPLPKNVTRHHVLMSMDAEIIISGHKFQVSEIVARAGLTQGSLTAPYVASKMLEPMLDLSVGEAGCSYIDNITTWGRSEAEVQTRLGTLASTVSKHPAGRHHLKFQRTSRIGSREMDVVGYRFRRDAYRWGSTVRALPSIRAITSQERKLVAQLVLVGGDHHETAIATWASGWPKRYPQWQGRHFVSDKFEITAMTELWPLARMIRRAAVHSRAKFRSFGEMGEFAQELSRLHQPEPDWAAIENGAPLPHGFVMTAAVINSAISNYLRSK
jgi:hypothetical protein